MVTNEEAIEQIKILKAFTGYEKDNPIIIKLHEALDMAIKALDQTDKIEESNFSTEQYKADLQGAYDCGYNSGYAQAMMDIAESEDEE